MCKTKLQARGFWDQKAAASQKHICERGHEARSWSTKLKLFFKLLKRTQIEHQDLNQVKGCLLNYDNNVFLIDFQCSKVKFIAD